jgi:hypothetical protein
MVFQSSTGCAEADPFACVAAPLAPPATSSTTAAHAATLQEMLPATFIYHLPS